MNTETATVMIVVIGALLLLGCPNPTAPEDTAVPAEDESNTGEGGDPSGTEDPGEPLIRVSSDTGDLASQGTVSFDQLNSTNSSSDETITIHNDGSAELIFTKIELGGANGEDSLDASTQGVFNWLELPDTSALAAGASRELKIEISYSAQDTSEFFSGTLTIESNTAPGGTSPFVVNLSAEFVDIGGGMGPIP
jgi:hypothetical protein